MSDNAKRIDRMLSLIADAISRDEELVRRLFPDIDGAVERNLAYLESMFEAESDADDEQSRASFADIVREWRRDRGID